MQRFRLLRYRRERPEVDAVVVTKLDRLSRGVVDAGRLLEEARKRGFKHSDKHTHD